MHSDIDDRLSKAAVVWKKDCGFLIISVVYSCHDAAGSPGSLVSSSRVNLVDGRLENCCAQSAWYASSSVHMHDKM